MLKERNACTVEILKCKDHRFPIWTHQQATSVTRGAIMSICSRPRFQKSPLEVAIRSIKFWHAVAGAGIGDMAVGPRSGAGVLYRTYARSVGFHAAWYVRP